MTGVRSTSSTVILPLALAEAHPPNLASPVDTKFLPRANTDSSHRQMNSWNNRFRQASHPNLDLIVRHDRRLNSGTYHDVVGRVG